MLPCWYLFFTYLSQLTERLKSCSNCLNNFEVTWLVKTNIDILSIFFNLQDSFDAIFATL